MKWIGIALLAIFAVILLLLVLPLGVRVKLAQGSLEVYAKAFGIIGVKVYPMKKKTPKPSKEKDKKKSEPKKNEKKHEKKAKEQGNASANNEVKPEKPSKVQKYINELTFDKVIDLLKLAAEAVKGVFRGFYVSNLELHAAVHDDDPAKTAMIYGGACAALETVVPMLESAFRIKKRDISVYPMFMGETEYQLDVSVMTVPIRLIALAVLIFIKWLKINKKHKAVQ
ncbi:MAG: DUF2953 domain-containing protein [Clostridia bacterium]|nr:DUF2953 domain-containing protein [Clostridia bacterium]